VKNTSSRSGWLGRKPSPGATAAGNFGSSSLTGASVYRNRKRDIPYLLQFARNVGPMDSVGDESEKKNRMRRITEWLSAQWKYNLAPTPEMFHAVALLTRAHARTQLVQQEAFGGYQGTPDTASTGKNGAMETQTSRAVSPMKDEFRQAIPNSDLEDEQPLRGPSSDRESRDPGRSLQELSTQHQEPSAGDSPPTNPGPLLPEQFRDITERTYFIIEAAALVHSQDKPGELVAAYSTNDPYLKDVTLVCIATSSRDLLEKLRNEHADNQKLLIQWGESQEELEQLPDILRAYLSLKETGKTVSGMHEAVQHLRSFFENARTKRGRPRKDALSERVQELRKSGHSWGEIHRRLNKETGVERTPSAYRNLLRSREKPE
jgi:hypothetical protein